MHLLTVLVCFLTAVAIAALVFLPVKVHLYYKHDGAEDNLHVEYRVFKGFLVRQINTSPAKMKGDKKSPSLALVGKLGSLFTKKEVSSKAIDEKNSDEAWFIFLFKKVKVEEIEWRTDIGMGDAAETGVLTGLLWAVKGSIVSYYKNKVGGLKKKHIVVVPHYERMLFATNVNCIFTMRLGHIMLAGLKKATGKRFRGGE